MSACFRVLVSNLCVRLTVLVVTTLAWCHHARILSAADHEKVSHPLC